MNLKTTSVSWEWILSRNRNKRKTVCKSAYFAIIKKRHPGQQFVGNIFQDPIYIKHIGHLV